MTRLHLTVAAFVLAVLCGAAYMFRYERLSDEVLWDRWSHRGCVVMIGGVACTKADPAPRAVRLPGYDDPTH